MKPRLERRRGVAIIVVLVVTALLSLGAYTFADLMLAEHQAADAHGRALQSRQACASGLEKLKMLLAFDAETLLDRGGLYDNPAELQGIPVLDGGAGDRVRFTIVAPLYEPGAAPALRYGIEDETGKLNLNTFFDLYPEELTQREMLMTLPGMTEETADAILDWIDDDDETRELGAEADYYSGLAPAYAPNNGPLNTLEELLLVKGVTPTLLFGPDANRNGFLDNEETAVALPEGVENSDGSFDRGWSGYLTLYGAEANRKADGTPRININGDDLEALYAELQTLGQPDLASFIINYRQSGPYNGSAAANASLSTSVPPDLTKSARYTFSTILDLIGAKTSATISGNTIAITSPVPNDPFALGSMLPLLMDNLTTTSQTVLAGRLNVNQAPEALLLGIPGLTEEQIDQIVTMRYPEPTDEMPGSEHPTWIFTQGIVTLEEMKALLPYLTARGAVFRAQIIGYYDERGPATRAEAVIDTTGSVPRQVLWREMSHLGRGFDPAVLGAAGP